MYIDQLWSQSWVSPQCSSTLLQLPHVHMCCFSFSLFGGLCKKMEPRENNRESQWHFVMFLFCQRLLTRSLLLAGSTQRLVTCCFLFHSVPREKKKNAQPVTCAWASKLPCRNTNTHVKKTSHVLKLTLHAGLFSPRNKRIVTAFFPKIREPAQGFSGNNMDRSEHDGTERTRCAELGRKFHPMCPTRMMDRLLTFSPSLKFWTRPLTPGILGYGWSPQPAKKIEPVTCFELVRKRGRMWF